MIAPSTVDEDGEITLDSFYFIMEGDKINAFANALTSANFEVSLQEEIGLDDNWDEYTLPIR